MTRTNLVLLWVYALSTLVFFVWGLNTFANSSHLRTADVVLAGSLITLALGFLSYAHWYATCHQVSLGRTWALITSSLVFWGIVCLTAILAFFCRDEGCMILLPFAVLLPASLFISLVIGIFLVIITWFVRISIVIGIVILATLAFLALSISY